MKRVALFSLAVLLATSGVVTAQSSNLVALVALFEVDPGSVDQFEAKVFETGLVHQQKSGFVGERFLRNVDPLNTTYALYTKFTQVMDLEASWSERLPQLEPYLRRSPEIHVAEVTDTFTPALVTDRPNGDEFGAQRTGQIAHLGLFIPFPEHRQEYERILHLVKNDTRDRQPSGFLGEDLLVEVAPSSVEEQAPHSPRALELVPMSINYGEFETIEEAENAYIQRASDRTDDPRLRYWYRAFFGSLQVPSRFYIYEVIGNLPSEGELTPASLRADARNGLATTGR